MRASLPELMRSVYGVFVSAVVAQTGVVGLAQAMGYFSSRPGGMPLGVDGPPPLLEVAFVFLFVGGLLALLAGPLVFAARWAGAMVGGRFTIVLQYALSVIVVAETFLLLNGGSDPFNAYSALVSVMTAVGAVATANWLSSRDVQEEPCAS